MTRSLPQIQGLHLFLIAAVSVAALTFGATKWLMTPNAEVLPKLDISADALAAKPGALDPAKLFAERKATTVMIDATIGDSPLTGAGVVVDAKRGLIMTASHVIHSYTAGQDARSIMISFASGDELPAQIIARDRANDLAILRVDANKSSTPLVAAPIGNSDELVVGAEIAAIGLPLGQRWTQTVGHVSAIHREVDSKINAAWSIPDMVQFDAPINPGNSGGPLFNARGEVVGIVQQIAGSTGANTGISFAVSSQLMQRALRLSEKTSDIPVAYTGLKARTLSPQLAKHAGLEATYGALVQHADGPAQRAGISTGRTVAYAGQAVATGDVVVALAGKEIRSANDLQRVAGLLDPNEQVDVEILRGDKRFTLQLIPTIVR